MKRSKKHKKYIGNAKPHIYLLCKYQGKDFEVWCAKSSFYSIEQHGVSPLHALNKFRGMAYA
tara:strand:+ start:104 stop:289 length:186 start_codon:yes stop_codon:yes gene_type:complete